MPDQRDVRGMHISNGPQWHVEQCLRAAGEAGAVTILHHLMRDDPLTQQHSDIENGRWYSKLRFGHPPQGIPPAPRRLIHVRMYHPNWMSLDPKAWARHTVDMLAAIDSGGRIHDLWADPLVTISPANEQNLHYECGFADPATQPQFQTVDHYRRIAAWNAAWADEVNRLRPDRKATLCWPALAFGHEPPGYQPDGEYSIPELRKAIDRYEIMATHPYALLHTHGPATAPGGADAFFFMLRDFRPAGFDNPRDPGGVLAQLPDKPLLITESGTFTHSDASRTRETVEAMAGLLRVARDSGRVLGVTWFIWHSDGAHPDNKIWPNEQLRLALERAPAHPTTATVPAARVDFPPAPLPGGTMDILPALRARLGDRLEDNRAAVLAAGRSFAYTDPSRHARIVVHHTAGPRDQTWQQIDAFHRAAEPNGNGWPGIGYHLLIRQGRVHYVGDIATERAHTWGRNADSIGVCITGRYDGTTRPAAEDVAALRDVIAAIDHAYGRELPILGHGAAAIPGHGTACPGSMLAAVLPALRGGSTTDLDVAALQQAERAHVLPINPAASLVKAIDAAGMWPTSPETTFVHAGHTYHVQRGESPTGKVAAFYCRAGDWANVRRVDRAA